MPDTPQPAPEQNPPQPTDPVVPPMRDPPDTPYRDPVPPPMKDPPDRPMHDPDPAAVPRPAGPADQGLERGLPQSQRIADHADRRQRHRGSADDRREQDAEHRIEHAGGNRHARRIVDES